MGTRNVEAVIKKGKGIDIRSSIVGLLVLKSTGSAFHGFVRDEYTTLPEVWERILAAVPEVATVEYKLPNKHYFEIDLAWHKGTKNTGKDAEVYAPQSGPNGLIQVVVARGSKPSKL